MNKPTLNQLLDLEHAARFSPDESDKPEATLTINDTTYSVRYFRVNRKCYDGMTTPTAMFKINGKRVSWKVWRGSVCAIKVAA
jgi:hypothetical protein